MGITMENEEKFELDNLINIKNQIYFLGTNHLSIESGAIVENSIKSLHLNAVMIELDELRYENLTNHMENTSPIQTEHVEGSNELFNDTEKFFNQLHNIQKEFGNILDVTPGTDMISAINVIKQLNLPLFFIDRPIIETIERMQESNKQIKNEEKEFISTIEDDSFFSEDKIDEILDEFKNPEFIQDFLKEFKENYPNLFKIFITERNEYMAEYVYKYVLKYPSHRILIITGMGHLRGLFSLMEKKLHTN